MPSPLVECVPNFSEGRNSETLHRITAAIREVPGVMLLGDERDEDHNRAVITYVAPPRAAIDAAVRAAAVAVETIDLNSHSGVHPRIGALDVLPFVPLRNITLAECAQLAREAASLLWERCGIPCYLYEAAALRPERRSLAEVRRGQFELLRHLAETQEDRRPDVGGPPLHPTAGATAVGARRFLVAWNVELNTPRIEIAREIATLIRQSSGGFPFVKALGLPLPRRGITQVSMNLTGIDETPMHVVFAAICEEARKRGVEVLGSELIGFVPRSALEVNFEESLRLTNFRPESVLENRIETLMSQHDSYDGRSGLTASPTQLSVRAATLFRDAISLALRRPDAFGPTDSALDWQSAWSDCRRLTDSLGTLLENAAGTESGTGYWSIAADLTLELAERNVAILTWLTGDHTRSNVAPSGGSPHGLRTMRRLLEASLALAAEAGLSMAEESDGERADFLRRRFGAFADLL